MKRIFGFAHVIAVASVVLLLMASFVAPAPGQNMPEVAPPPPLTKAKTPKPEPAQEAILALFDKYEVVGIGSPSHGSKDLDDFLLDLVRNPELPNKINDIAVECGNSLYQPILDRYIAGEDVPLAEAQHAWRDSPQAVMSVFYEEFFPLVREINKHLPPEKKLRVLATEPPIDWSKVKTREDLRQFPSRDASIASVMEKEVLSKHHKALMFFGIGHLAHVSYKGDAVEIYEKDYPNVTYVIKNHDGFSRNVPSGVKYSDELEKRMASWPVPSLVNIKGSWLADLDAGYLGLFPDPAKVAPGQQPPGLSIVKAVDGYLYLGPSYLLLYQHVPANVVLDKAYLDELQHRPGWGPILEGILVHEKANYTLFKDGKPHNGPGPVGLRSSGPSGPGGEKPSSLPGQPSQPPPR